MFFRNNSEIHIIVKTDFKFLTLSFDIPQTNKARKLAQKKRLEVFFPELLSQGCKQEYRIVPKNRTVCSQN